MKNLKMDLVSGFVVFLIALPLSIGIALAAGAPASAGIVSAILGGILGTFFTGSHIVINGPAAGLIVVILSSIQVLGGGDAVLGFKRTLAAVFVAGLLQVIFGFLKMGRLAFLAPSAVVHGMLSAIGVIILIKQIPVLFGVFPQSKSIMGMLGEIPSYVIGADLPIAIIGVSCICILILWNKFSGNLKKIIPGPLVVVILGLIFSYIFDISNVHDVLLFNHKYHIGPDFLVHVPESISKLIIFPTFDIIFTYKSIVAILTIFIVCSLESLLSAYAVDKLDPQKRKSDLDKDLLGKGIINMACGLLGAYPVISEIVRSSANIENGAQTKWSNFFHGMFILLFVAIFPTFINLIPLAALSAVLLLVGFNLAHPKHFFEVFHHGRDQFLIFCTTLVVTLVEDLLIGIASGVVLKIILHSFRGVKLKEFLNPQVDILEEDGKSVLVFNSAATFLGYLKIQKIIKACDRNIERVDFNDMFVDFTIRELVKDSIHDAVDVAEVRH